jgi:hypothetical protein
MNKLSNFPSFHFIGISDSQNRRENLYKNLKEYNIQNVIPHVYEKYKHGDHKINVVNWWGNFEGYLGTTTSHLKAIFEWYHNTDEPYAFFCEDDLSLETINYWNFTWEEFFNILPKTWECVQLCVFRHNMFAFWQPEVYIRHRCWDDYGCVAYLMSRNHAKKLLDSYYDGETFNLKYNGWDKHTREEWATRPSIETLIYTNFQDDTVYNFPLFVEDINLPSTVWKDETDNNQVSEKVNKEHEHYYNEIMNWWKNKGQYFTINDFKDQRFFHCPDKM